MHRFIFAENIKRFFVVLCSGNLTTTQGVITRLKRDMKNHEHESLLTVTDIDRAAEYIGHVSTEEQRKHHQSRTEDDFLPEASFLLGGQIYGESPSIAHIYPEGNFIHGNESIHFLQIGEVKYGKPILDRIVTRGTSLANALKCGLVSVDSTLRSNATVGPPIEYLVYRKDQYQAAAYARLEEDDDYLLTLRKLWAQNIQIAFDALPNPAGLEESAIVTRLDS